MKTYKRFTYLLPLFLLTVQASQQDFNNHNTNLEPEKEDLELQKGIEKYLPEFFENNQQMLDKLQQGQRQAVVVIGQTGAGKSTLIGGLLGHKFEIEEKEVTKREDDTEEETDSDDDIPVPSNDENNKQTNPERILFVNKTPGAPTIGHSTTMAETIFPTVYLDPKSNLAFIDTAGLGDTRRDGPIINLCSALSLRSLIEKIGSIKCIINVVEYDLFKAGKASNIFFNLLNVTSSLLQSKSYETCASSIILTLTKVPSGKTKNDVNEALESQCEELMQKKENKKMTEEDKIAEAMYKILFPSYYGIKNKKDLPFFLIGQNSLLKQGLVRKNILPKLQNATKVYAKDIGLVLQPSLLHKTRDWLVKKAQSIVAHIRRKEYTEKKIIDTKKNLSFIQQQLCKDQLFFKQLTYSNNKDKKETFKKCLKQTIQNNTQRIQQLDLIINSIKNQVVNNETQRQEFDTNSLLLHTKISGRYNKHTKKYHYYYNNENVPIDHIFYDNNIGDPKSGDRVSETYKVVSITKDYDEGRLSIILENNISGGAWAIATLGTAITSGIGWLFFAAILAAAKYETPKDFYIYAKKKHIYHNHINTLKENIKYLNKRSFKAKYNKKHLEYEIQCSRYYLERLQPNNLTQDLLKNNGFGNETLQQVTLGLLQEKEMIEQTKQSIKNKKKAIQNIKSDLQILKMLLNLSNKNIKQNEIIPYIITQVAPFIEFHNCDQHNLNTCKQYCISNPNQYKQYNNINTNKKHSDYQPDGELEQNENDDYDNNNNNRNYIDYQSDGELEQKEDDDCDNNNNNNSSSPTSSLLLGATLVSGSLLKKKN